MNDDISFSVRNQLRITFHYIGLVKSAYSRSASLSLVRQTSIASFLHSAGLVFPSSPPPLPTLPSSLTSPSSLLPPLFPLLPPLFFLLPSPFLPPGGGTRLACVPRRLAGHWDGQRVRTGLSAAGGPWRPQGPSPGSGAHNPSPWQ